MYWKYYVCFNKTLLLPVYAHSNGAVHEEWVAAFNDRLTQLVLLDEQHSLPFGQERDLPFPWGTVAVRVQQDDDVDIFDLETQFTKTLFCLRAEFRLAKELENPAADTPWRFDFAPIMRDVEQAPKNASIFFRKSK